MSGWVVVTLDPVEGKEWALEFAEDDSEYLNFDTELSDDYEKIEKALCRELLSYDRIDEVGIDEPEVYAYSNHGAGSDIESILRETEEMWERAVVLRVNDTGGTGVAVLYEQTEVGVEATDEFVEAQCDCCGGRNGRLAAAHMLAEHHIQALADFYPVPYSKFECESNIDEWQP